MPRVAQATTDQTAATVPSVISQMLSPTPSGGSMITSAAVMHAATHAVWRAAARELKKKTA